MQLEIQDGVTFQTATSFHEAWRIWHGGNLAEKVSPLSDISDNSIFPRVVLDAQMEEFLQQRHLRALSRYGDAIGTETLALGVRNLDEAWAVMQDIYSDDFSLQQVISPRTSTTGTALNNPPTSPLLPRRGPPSEATIVVESAYSTISPPLGENTVHPTNLAPQSDPAYAGSISTTSPARSMRLLPGDGSTLQKAHHMFFATGRRVVDLHSLRPSTGEPPRVPTPASFITNPSDIVDVRRTSFTSKSAFCS